MHPFAYVVTTPIKIDIWSDIACPWCYIGTVSYTHLTLPTN